MAPEIAVETEAARKQISDEQDADLLGYLKSLKAESPIQVSVNRVLPKSWRGKTLEGHLDTYDEPIGEEEIRELFGGGKYRLKISTLNGKGQWNYAAQRTIKISGDPIVDGLINTSGGGNSSEENPSVVRDALRMAADSTQRAEARAAAATAQNRQPQGPDPAMQMVMNELRSAREEAAAKDDRLFGLMNKKETGAAEMLLGKAIDGESARIQAIQLRIDSELRTRIDMHKAEIDRLHQRYEDIATRQETAHTREVDFMRQGIENQMATLKVSYEGQIQGYQREIAHLDRELTAAKTELAALRAKKDKPMLESLTEMAAMKDAIESFSGKEEGSTLERIVGNVMGSPLLEGVATRLAGGPAAVGAEMAQPEADIPFNRPVQLPDGRVIVRKADGGIVQLKRKVIAPTPTGEVGVVIPDEDIQTAIEFMESALTNDADPAEFIRTAKNLAPQITSGPIRQLLETQGVDGFLARVAKLEPNSSLLSQHGKNWVRKVAAALLG